MIPFTYLPLIVLLSAFVGVIISTSVYLILTRNL